MIGRGDSAAAGSLCVDAKHAGQGTGQANDAGMHPTTNPPIIDNY